MTKKEVKVLVIGEMNSGKSTISQLIYDALRARGISAELYDEPLAESWMENQDRRVDVLIAQLGVKVETRQVPRGTIDTYVNVLLPPPWFNIRRG